MHEIVNANSNQKWNNKTCQWECKIYVDAKETSNPSTCIWENSKYLRSCAGTSGIACDKIISVMDIVSTKMTKSIAINVTNNASLNSHSKN